MISRISNIFINVLVFIILGTYTLSANNWPEFTPKATISAGVYVVTQDHTVTTDMTMQEGVTLIFEGGKLTGSAKITGNYTQIIASKTQIFDTSLSFDGIWNINRAYPEWFGAKPSIRSKPFDCSIAINKAIELKQVGEVYISRGNYYIKYPINMKYGIILCGEKALMISEEENAGSTICLWPYDNENCLPHFSSTKDFIITVNVKNASSNPTWVKPYPAPLTAIRNLHFYNNDVENAILKGILFAGGMEITHCRWWNFAQAVKSVSSVYADNKIITDCQFDNNINGAFDDSYAFDLSGLGDNLTFKRNHITKAGGSYKFKGLKVDKTNGAEICDNIINASSLIKDSKAVSFVSNHLEGDATQLTIQRSVVHVSNNFFEKGTEPSLVFDENADNYDLSVVSLVDNSFLYYEHEKKDNQNKDYIEPISMYDLQIDGRISLEISNSYRYWVKRNMISKVYPIGLTLCDKSGNSIDSFNKYSYFLSTKGSLKTASTGSNVCIPCNFALNTGNVSWTIMTNSQVKWKIESDIYTYSAILIWDKDRKIVHPKVNMTSVNPTKNGNGVLMWMNGANTIGHQAMVRLIRTGNNTTKYVDLPFTGTHFIYDNGLSVCGFPWKNADNSITEITGIMPIGAIEFVGNNVVCRSKTKPASTSGWKNGDIVYNLGSGTNAMWILSDNVWIDK